MTTTTRKRSTRKANQTQRTCRCSVYPFPHRENSHWSKPCSGTLEKAECEDCNGTGHITGYWQGNRVTWGCDTCGGKGRV